MNHQFIKVSASVEPHLLALFGGELCDEKPEKSKLPFESPEE